MQSDGKSSRGYPAALPKNLSPSLSAAALSGYDGHFVRGQHYGYRYLHSALDDRTRLVYSEILDDEQAATAAAFGAASRVRGIGYSCSPPSVSSTARCRDVGTTR